MLRAKTLLFLILSTLLILTSCSETTTDPGEDGEGEESIEPTASVSNPSDGAVLDGEITFIIEGESENGFDEARIFIGEEQVETVENPSLPYEQTIPTYDYNNGDYDLSAELDVADEDTTIEATISTTFENYMVTLETDGYIEMLQDTYEASYMFIANPEGKVLREIELTAYNDGTINLLPPSLIEGEAPEQFTVTLGYKSTNSDGIEEFRLSTYAGFEAWSNIHKTVESSANSDNEGKIPVLFSNYPEEFPPGAYNLGQDANLSSHTAWILSPRGQGELNIATTSKEVMLTALPGQRGTIPRYYLEESLQDSLGGPDSLRVDIADDFEEFVTNTVSIPNGYSYGSSTSFVQGEEAFDETSYFFFDHGYPYDMNPSDNEVVVAVPDVPERSVGYLITLSSSSDNVSASEQVGDQESLPSDFDLLDASITVTNNSLDDIQLDVTGSADYIWLNAENTSSGTNSWEVRLPDTTTEFIYPSISDSLDASVTVHDRSSLELDDAEMWDYEGMDGYTGLISTEFSQSPTEYPFNYRNWVNYNISGQSKSSRVASENAGGGAGSDTKSKINE